MIPPYNSEYPGYLQLPPFIQMGTQSSTPQTSQIGYLLTEAMRCAHPPRATWQASRWVASCTLVEKTRPRSTASRLSLSCRSWKSWPPGRYKSSNKSSRTVGTASHPARLSAACQHRGHSRQRPRERRHEAHCSVCRACKIVFIQGGTPSYVSSVLSDSGRCAVSQGSRDSSTHAGVSEPVQAQAAKTVACAAYDDPAAPDDRTAVNSSYMCVTFVNQSIMFMHQNSIIIIRFDNNNV